MTCRIKQMVLLLAVTILCSCVIKQEVYYTGHYVETYCFLSGIKLSSGYRDGVININNYGWGKYVTIYSWASKGVYKEKYDLLCSKHNDIGYKGEYVTFIGPEDHRFYSTDFLSVEITSDSDYDATHPAGTSLGDITLFCTGSPKKYIDSGYKTLYVNNPTVDLWTQQCFTDNPERHYVCEYLSQLTPDDLVLIGSGRYEDPMACILFDIKPTLSKTHKFTVTLTCDNGRQLSSSIDYTFE